jgi:hypothetical protein
MSHRTYLEWKHNGDNSMCGKREGGEGMCASRPARLVHHGESYTALSPVLGGSPSLPWLNMPYTAMTPLPASNTARRGLSHSTVIVRGGTVRPMKPGKRTNGTPTVRYYVQQQRTTGSPKGREPYGDGVPIVAKDVPPARSSEGEQVTKTTRKRGGTRDA